MSGLCGMSRFALRGSAGALWLLAFSTGVFAQSPHFFTAPFGEGGTWNLYEIEGLPGTPVNPRLALSVSGEIAATPATWHAALADAEGRVESLSGKSVAGHLLSVGGAEENAGIRSRVPAESSYWIGLTDDEVFGGGETSTGQPLLDGLAGLNGPVGDGVGWEWSNGEPFRYGNWRQNSGPQGASGADYVAVLGRTASGQWSDAQSEDKHLWVVEYETRMPADFLLEAQAARAPGPQGGWGTWGVREIVDPTQGEGLAGALNTLFSPAPQAKTVDYQTPVLDYVDQTLDGQFTIDREFASGRAVDKLALVAHGKIRVPEGRGGPWQFRVDSDDAFEIYVSGKRFDPIAAPIQNPNDATQTTIYGSLTYPADRSFDKGPSVGSIQLEPGDHDIEMVYHEYNGLAALEVSAKGPGDQQFALVGDPGVALQAATPFVRGGFQVQEVVRQGIGPVDPIDNLAEARALLASPAPSDAVYQGALTGLDLSAGSWAGWFPEHHGFLHGLDSNFALQAEGILQVDVAGEYTFGFHGAGGAALTINGAAFSSLSELGVVTAAGQTLSVEDQPRQYTPVLGRVWLEAGDYPLELVMFDHEGPAQIELMVSPSGSTLVSRDAFRLLRDAPQRIDLHRPEGLQLVPEPPYAWALLTLALVRCAVRRKQGRTSGDAER
ncbi:MAG: PA14 domain-containing protein [Pirellulales bacterium]